MVAFNSLLALLVIIAALPQLWLQMKFSRQRYGLAFDLSPDERRAFYISHLLSSIETAKEIRLFGLAEYLLNGLLSLYRKINQARQRQELHELRWKLALETLSASTFGVAFGVVAIQAFSKRMSIGDITLYINAMRSLQEGVSSLFAAIAGINEHVLFFTEYDRLMALPQPISVAPSPRPVPKLSQGIEIRNVSFRYGEVIFLAFAIESCIMFGCTRHRSIRRAPIFLLIILRRFLDLVIQCCLCAVKPEHSSVHVKPLLV